MVPSANFVNSAKVSMSGNRRDDLCDYCGSGQIELVEYTPPFLGGDYGTHDPIPVEVKTGDDYDPSKVPHTAPGFIATNNLLLDNIIIPQVVESEIYDLSDMD